MTPNREKADQAAERLFAAWGVGATARDEPASLAVSMVGRQYRVVMSAVVGGVCKDTPVDDLLFDSIGEARKHLKALRGVS